MHCGSRGAKAGHLGRKKLDRDSENGSRLGKGIRGRPSHRKSIDLAIRSMGFGPTHLMRFIALALTM